MCIPEWIVMSSLAVASSPKSLFLLKFQLAKGRHVAKTRHMKMSHKFTMGVDMVIVWPEAFLKPFIQPKREDNNQST